MSQTLDKTIAPDFLPPLHGGRTRSETVTAQLAELSGLSRQAVLRRAAETGAGRRLERETLVAVVRGFLRAGREDDGDTVLLCLIRQVSGGLKAKISAWRGLTPEDKTDAERQMVTLLCEKACDLRPGAEFWECNFTTCFNRRLISLWHTLTDHALPMASNTGEMGDGETWDRVEQFADPADAPADVEMEELVRLVSGDHPKKGRALFLRMHGFSDEEIAAQIGVTSRTLRNWAADARAVWERLQIETQS